MSLSANHSYSHTHHYVTQDQFNSYIQGLLNSDVLNVEKKSKLQTLMQSDIWKQIQQSSYWRHNIFNGGLSGPFTEYFARFNPTWKKDFWGELIQPIDITYLSENAIPRAYQSTVMETQAVLVEHVKKLHSLGQKKVEIASLASGTMYDVLGANYDDSKSVSFCGYDVDADSLRLAKEKASLLGYGDEQVKTLKLNVVDSPLKDQYDIIVCNGFSFYIDDEELSQLIDNVKVALKENGVFLMSFIQPFTVWKLNEEEKTASKLVQQILDAVPMKWSANLRTSDQVVSFLNKKELVDISILSEEHEIHPCILAHKG